MLSPDGAQASCDSPSCSKDGRAGMILYEAGKFPLGYFPVDVPLTKVGPYVLFNG